MKEQGILEESISKYKMYTSTQPDERGAANKRGAPNLRGEQGGWFNKPHKQLVGELQTFIQEQGAKNRGILFA